MANAAHADLRLRKIPTELTVSILTDTNSTISELPGPRRLLGSILSSVGKRLEHVLTRAALRLGFGPDAIASRMVTLIWERHRREHPACTYALTPNYKKALEEAGNPGSPIDFLLSHACLLCPGCGSLWSLSVEEETSKPHTKYVRLMSKMLDYTGYACFSDAMSRIDFSIPSPKTS